MKRWLSLLLALLMLSSLIACTSNVSGDKEPNNNPSSNPSTDNGNKEAVELEGKLVYLSRNDETINNPMIEAFNQKYPKVAIEVLPAEEDLEVQVATLAAADQLPDVIENWHLASFATNGWLAPLNEFMENDPDLEFAVKEALESCKYFDKYYALPEFLQFVCLFVNKDLLYANNYDMPAYDWTVSDMEALLKKFTTSKLSGINHVWGLEWDLTAVMDPSAGWMTYKDGKFDFTNPSYLDAVSVVQRWKKAGYVSDDLAEQPATKEGFENAFEEKFGVGVPAIDSGFVALGYIGYWDWNSWVRELPFEKDIIPIPRADNGEISLPLQTDYVSIAASSKNKDAAYAFAKFLSIDPAGLTTLFNTINTLPVEAQPLIAPASNHPDVLAAYEAVESYPEGAKWMLRNINKSFCDDPQKRIPNWGSLMWDVMYPQMEKVMSGELSMTDIAQELTQRANETLEADMAEAKKIMDKVQAEYEQKYK